MVQAILMWTGVVLASGLILLMALGPVIVEADSWWYERRRVRRRARRAGTSTQNSAISTRMTMTAMTIGTTGTRPGDRR